ncbi:TetR/AcrR family transcriptional regulator [Arthrobacter tecti]
MGRSSKKQSEETAQLLVTVAMELFGTRGFAEVGLEEVAANAQVTRGAVYHHFGSKIGLFKAVLDRVQKDVADQITEAAARATSGWDGLVAGCHAFIGSGSDPLVHRIMLIDAPAVVGWREWMNLDAAHSRRLLEAALQRLEKDGVIAPDLATPATRLLSGAMNEAALWIARSEEPERDLQLAGAALDRMLNSLRSSP